MRQGWKVKGYLEPLQTFKNVSVNHLHFSLRCSLFQLYSPSRAPAINCNHGKPECQQNLEAGNLVSNCCDQKNVCDIPKFDLQSQTWNIIRHSKQMHFASWIEEKRDKRNMLLLLNVFALDWSIALKGWVCDVVQFIFHCDVVQNSQTTKEFVQNDLWLEARCTNPAKFKAEHI